VLLENPTQFLSSVQVGITSIGMLNGIIGEAAFSDDLAVWLLSLGMPDRAAEITATALVVTIITFITIVFGELVPKRIGQLYPETVARLVAVPMTWVATDCQALCTAAVVQHAGRAQAAAHRQRRADVGDRRRNRGQPGRGRGRRCDRAARAPDGAERVSPGRPAADLADGAPLGHRVAGRRPDASPSACSKAGQGGAHSWYPVCRGSLDDVVGVVSVARLLALGPAARGTVEAHVQPALFVPETLTGMELLEQFRARSGRMVFVVDEYGVVQGLMTPHDLLEAITGELQPGAQADAWATQRDDGSWLLDGLMPVAELRQPGHPRAAG
jgi:putative hemolysin